MEGYGRHSRSHFKAAPPHPSSAVAGAGNGTGFYKKPYSNGGGAGGNAFMAYDDVFGGPPKFGATPFAPRAEDYSEIFGSFRSSRTSSIPMLDLPPVDNSVDAFEVLGCTGLEYTEIFGGFDFADFAASYDELFRRSDGSEESSDDAWTPVGTESPSEASDPYASSGRNQYFLNSDFHETPEDTMFDASYNNVKLGTTEDTEQTDEGQHSFVSGYTYMVEGSTTRKEDEERYSSGVADDIILCEDSSGNISVETRRKTASIRSHSGVVKQSHGYEEPSHLPPLSKLRPTIDERKKDPAETIFEGGSLDFFDVELNAGSSSIAAAAAMKEAMDRAKLKLNSAKELRKREKDGVESMLFVNNGLKRDVKVKMAFDDSILRDDELQSKCESESSVIKMYGDNMQDASEVSQVLPDTLQPEDEVSRAAEPAQRETAKNKRLSLDPGLIEEDGEWKVTTECYEFLNSKTEHTLPGNIEKPVQEVNSCHFDNVNGRTMSLKQMEHNVEGMDASIKDHEDLKSSDEACNPRDNRRRLRVTKAASRNAFHEKMLKLAQDVHKTVISDHVETQKRRNEGIEGDGAQRSPETWSVGGKSGRIYDQAAQQVQYDRKHEEESYESYLADSEIGSDEDLVQADCDKQGKEDCKLKGHQNGEKEAEAGKRVMSPRNENLSVLNQDLEQEGKRKSGKNEKQDSDVSLKKADEESTASKNEMREEVHTADKCEENAEVASSDCNGKILKESVDLEKCEQVDMATENIRKERINANDDPPTKSKRFERSNVTFKNEHEVDVYEKNEMEEPFKMIDLEKSQKMFECSAKNEELKMENKGALQSDFMVTDQDSNQKENLHLESEYFASIEPPTLDEEVLEMAGECDELKSSSSPSSLDGKDIKSFDMASEGEMKLENHVYEKETEFCSGTLNGQIESKVTEMEEFCITSRCPQKADAGQCMMSERKESARKQYPSSNINQRVSKEEKAVNGNVAAEDREMAEKLRRKEDSERELLREVQLENERELERELEKEHVQKHEDELEKESLRKLVEEREKECLQKLEEEREKERLRKLEEEREKERLWKLEEETKERHRKLEEEREKEGLRKLEEEREKERLRKLEEEREKERLQKLEEEREKERLRKLEEEREKERLRKLEEEREKDKEKELEKLRLRRLEELRERERVKELEKEERQKEREKDLEKERLRKLEEEWEREREREKDRMGVELKMPAAHERAAVERATVEARQRAMSEARERLEKVCAEAREKSFGKTSKEAQLRAERAAVERATAEARERAIEKAMTRDRVERSVSEKFSSSFREVELRHCSSSNDLWNSDKSDGVEGESAQRCKARLDRHRRTVERVAKALAEKNMRDLIAQREQTERNRFAETLDADIKRWSNGKEGNLRALLSTLQYILGSESGWQPIPLTEVITSAAVKKAYRKATLCVHPDKLQQRGATIQQKYICEKVFDLLKDGWNRFNSEER